MSQKNFYIDDFKVRNCTQYGEYEIMNSLDSGDEVKIEYDSDEKNIVVRSKNKGNNQTDSGEIFGELEVPEQMRKIFVPLLLRERNDVFYCKINILDKKVMVNERFLVSVWAAKEKKDSNS